MLAIFVKQFIIKNFQKSLNLATLLARYALVVNHHKPCKIHFDGSENKGLLA